MADLIKVLFSTYDGLAVALEKELAKHNISIDSKGRSYCIVSIDKQTAANLIFMMQTPMQVMQVCQEYSAPDYESIFDNFDPDLLPKAKKYIIRATRIGNQKFRSPDIVNLVREKISHGNEFNQIIYRFYLEDDVCFAGFDLASDLARRDYRIFTHNSSVKGPVAASIVALSNLSGESEIIDPFCKDATLAIEAAFWRHNISPRKHNWEHLEFFELYDEKPNFAYSGVEFENLITAMDSSNHNLASAKKNIQIAGLKKYIKIVREDLEWLSTRFDDASVDLVLSVVPSPTQRIPEVKMKKIYSEFLEAVPILRGKMVLFFIDPSFFISEAKLVGLKVVSRFSFFMGKQKASVIILEK